MSALSRRRWDYDLLRVASMVGVVYLHTAAGALRQLGTPCGTSPTCSPPWPRRRCPCSSCSPVRCSCPTPGRRSWAPCFAAACPRC
ncbi:hypothetical protein M5E87_27020 [Flavonifractor plautii]|nr:hypothetical protein M5E87_27020 [Flavonifractor plautii]